MILFTGPIGKKMMIDQGYVPATCTMDDQVAGPTIWSEISRGVSPCAGCNADRLECGGFPKDPNYVFPVRKL